ncbi:MAG: peptide-methionine (S)-S-oxide reductase MsrA [Syntrophales bacterium]|jgi:peptide-methionine (S)-S-oxide reductase|nr:peptide-methionine (S)-S-oxide reductase MsrA [Syntrophales bacterium]MCK9392691.1 peptide-methionine (S)-S-oxide reductase MsrA [Syntrophales bacterium]
MNTENFFSEKVKFGDGYRRSIMVLMALLLLSILTTALPSYGKDTGMKNSEPLYEKATFAGGCFWCMESPFDKLPGVVYVTVGYTGGRYKNPTYEHVSAGRTGHAEAVQISFDPKKVAYKKLLAVFWHNIDPTTANRQFCDVGTQYRSAIFYHSQEQHELAMQSKGELEKSKTFKEAIVTQIVPAGDFYPAEDYHQHYYKKNPLRYKYYRAGCGRDQRLKELWGTAAGH